MTAGALCEKCEEDKSAISRALKALEESGYLETRAGKDSKYKNLLTLTEKGKQVVNFSHDMFVQIDEASFEGISIEQRKIFADVLEKMSENLKSLGGKDENNVV